MTKPLEHDIKTLSRRLEQNLLMFTGKRVSDAPTLRWPQVIAVAVFVAATLVLVFSQRARNSIPLKLLTSFSSRLLQKPSPQQEKHN